MHILFLDDGDIRHESAERHLSKNHTLLHAFHAEEALKILISCQERIGLAMLDHDLNYFVNDTGERVGYEYDGKKTELHGIWFLNQMFDGVPKDKWPAQFIIHSRNVPAAKNMHGHLLAYEQTSTILPFSGDMLKTVAARILSQ